MIYTDYTVSRMADGGRIYTFSSSELPDEASQEALNNELAMLIREAQLPRDVIAGALIVEGSLHIIVTPESMNANLDYTVLDVPILETIRLLP